MAEAANRANYEDGRMVATGVRRLSPADTQIFEGTFSLLHCAVKGDTLYRGVFAVLMFPITHPDRYVSLKYTDIKEKDQEIGLIENLNDFPPAQQKLVKESLVKHYYEQIITRVDEIESQYGLLFWTVQTRRGREEFTMPWRQDRAEDYGANGKVLLDALGNRYIVPNVSELPAADRRLFTSYIYW
jgi:hypothetical protein